MKLAEPALVEAACGGDRAAVEQLIAACQPNLRRFARRTCSTAEDSEDALQIALWQLHRKIGTLRTAAVFASWLFRIVERECYRLFRARSRTEAIKDPLEDTLVQDPVPLELRKDLIDAIASLPGPYREVLILRDIDELTAPEAAEQLGVSVEAAKSRLNRARSMVRERLLAGGYLSSSL